MLDRRQGARDKVIYGGVADIDQRGTSRNCIVRNISDNGASIEFSNVVNLPREQISLRIARKGRSFLAPHQGTAGRALIGSTPPCSLLLRVNAGVIAMNRRESRTSRRSMAQQKAGGLATRRLFQFAISDRSDLDQRPPRGRPLGAAAVRTA